MIEIWICIIVVVVGLFKSSSDSLVSVMMVALVLVKRVLQGRYLGNIFKFRLSVLAYFSKVESVRTM